MKLLLGPPPSPRPWRKKVDLRMLAVFVWFLLLYASVCIYLYVLNIGIHLLFLCNPSIILIFEHYLLKLLHVFPSETRFVLYAYIIFVHYAFFFIFIITSCNYLFIISTCHVISSVIFWRHSQQVAYHVIYKVLVTWHMIFSKEILHVYHFNLVSLN